MKYPSYAWAWKLSIAIQGVTYYWLTVDRLNDWVIVTEECIEWFTDQLLDWSWLSDWLMCDTSSCTEADHLPIAVIVPVCMAALLLFVVAAVLIVVITARKWRRSKTAFSDILFQENPYLSQDYIKKERLLPPDPMEFPRTRLHLLNRVLGKLLLCFLVVDVLSLLCLQVVIVVVVLLQVFIVVMLLFLSWCCCRLSSLLCSCSCVTCFVRVQINEHYFLLKVRTMMVALESKGPYY